jgi:hypothetical protein
MTVEYPATDGYGLSEMSYLELSAADIVKGETEATGVSSEAGSLHPELPLLYHGQETIQCNGGYVMTGMKVKTKSAESPYPGKMITGVRIKCKKLEKI